MDMCKRDKGEGPQKPRPLVWLRKQGNPSGFKTVACYCAVRRAWVSWGSSRSKLSVYMKAVTVRGNDPTHPPRKFHLLVASSALHERAGRLRERQAFTEHHLQILQRPFKADIVEALLSVCMNFFSIGALLCPNGAGAPAPDLKETN